jgi:hypothetical protein
MTTDLTTNPPANCTPNDTTTRPNVSFGAVEGTATSSHSAGCAETLRLINGSSADDSDRRNGLSRAVEATSRSLHSSPPDDTFRNTDRSLDSLIEDSEPYDPFSGMNPDSRLMTISEQKACIMLSELFLDLELSDFHLRWIARELFLLKDLSPVKLKRLLRDEVFPVLWVNLKVIAGEWAEFDHKWLLSWIEFRRRWRVWAWTTSPLHFLAWIDMSEYVNGCFEKVMNHMEDMKMEETKMAAAREVDANDAGANPMGDID